MSHTAKIRQMYDIHRAHRLEVRAELEARIDGQIDARLHDEIVEIQEAIQSAYEEGVTVAELRRAVRAYGNAIYWDKWWTGPDLRRGRPSKNLSIPKLPAAEAIVVGPHTPWEDDPDFIITEVTFNANPKGYTAVDGMEFPHSLTLRDGSWMHAAQIDPAELTDAERAWRRANRTAIAKLARD